MEVRQDDVWVVTFPKCGTTWTQELVWQVAHNCDFEGGKQLLEERFPFLEVETLMDPEVKVEEEDFVDKLAATFSRRFIKTHLPLSLLPSNLLDTAKVVYVARNPRDVIVSFYHHNKLIKLFDFVGDLPEFARWFIRDKVFRSPFFPHVEEAWAVRDHPNMIFLFYEEMEKDLKEVICRVAGFLDTQLTEEQVTQLVEHLDIKNFRNNPAVNLEFCKENGSFNLEGSFIRKGKVGGWKEEFKDYPEVDREVNIWVEENMKKSKVQWH